MEYFTKRTWAEIDLDHLEHNLRIVQSHLGQSKVMATVKADAYGHCEAIITKKLVALGVDFFSVSNLDEAIAARRHAPEAQLLILGYTPVNAAGKLAAHRLVQTVFSLSYAVQLNQEAAKAGVVLPVHIAIDTGMSRIGFECNQKKWRMDELQQVFTLPALRVEGCFTHYCHADSIDPSAVEFTKRQRQYYDAAVAELRQQGCNPGILHTQNSAAIETMGDAAYAYGRAGIVLYGIDPSDEVRIPGLQPVMSVKTVVAQVKEVLSGTYIGYGRTYQAKQNIKVATLPIGYADGYPRLLSNRGDVLIHGQRAPIIGNICMDQMMVDVTGIPVQEGDTVTVLGTDGSQSITANELGSLIQTIGYEITCMVSARVPRVAFEHGQQVHNPFPDR